MRKTSKDTIKPKKVCRKFLSSLEVKNTKFDSLKDYYEKTVTVHLGNDDFIKVFPR